MDTVLLNGVSEWRKMWQCVREDDDIRDFRPASVALRAPLFSGVTIFFLSNGNYLRSSLTMCGSSPETGKGTQIMNYMVNTWVNTAARFQTATLFKRCCERWGNKQVKKVGDR